MFQTQHQDENIYLYTREHFAHRRRRRLALAHDSHFLKFILSLCCAAFVLLTIFVLLNRNTKSPEKNLYTLICLLSLHIYIYFVICCIYLYDDALAG